MATNYEKIAADLMKGKSNPALSSKSSAIKQLAGSKDAQKVRSLLGDEAAVKRAMESGDAAALQSIVKSVLSSQEGARLVAELAKMLE